MADPTIRIGIIGGTGLGEQLGVESHQAVQVRTPFGEPSPIARAAWDGRDVFLLRRHGDGHPYNPTAVPYRANIFALKALGVTHVVASGATGSLREDVSPGDLVIVDQVIDKTYRRPNTFYERAAVHVEFSEPMCPVMRRWLVDASGRLGGEVTVHDSGTYVCMEGPALSTRAESHMHRQWGGDLIGMTGMPEAKLAREAEIAYAMIGMPTDYDCWRPRDAERPSHELLREIMGNMQRAADASLALVKAALADVSPLEAEPSPAHSALALGIWSDKSKIPQDEVDKLRPLWGKYFEE